MKRILVPAAALLLAGSFAATHCAKRPAAAPGRLLVSGTVEATESRLGFPTAGRIQELAAHEGDRVTPGAVLARLDTSEADARHAQAVARLDASRALLDELLTGSRKEEIAQASAAVDAARERLADAERDRDRNRKLYGGGAVSLETTQKSDAAATVAAAQLASAREQLRLVSTGAREERIRAQRAQVREAEAALAGIEAYLTNTRIVAPLAGLVTVRHHEPNESVGAGQAIVTVIDPADRWVRVYVPEDRLGAIHVGTVATIRSDTYPAKRYGGRIVYISPEAEFTPKNVQTAEERVRLVYAVKVKIDRDPAMELKPGMAVDVELETGR